MSKFEQYRVYALPLVNSGYIKAMNVLFIDKLLVQQGFIFISNSVHLKEHLNSFYFTIAYC